MQLLNGVYLCSIKLRPFSGRLLIIGVASPVVPSWLVFFFCVFSRFNFGNTDFFSPEGEPRSFSLRTGGRSAAEELDEDDDDDEELESESESSPARATLRGVGFLSSTEPSRKGRLRLILGFGELSGTGVVAPSP